MTDMARYIVTPVMGAAIGYITNWLAIKMLFRPLTEKKIFGFKLPFTPGLIPKERGVLAEKVAETIDTHLLTGEALSRSLSSPETVAALRRVVSNTLENFKTDNSAIGEKLKSFPEYEKLLTEAEAAFINIAMNYAKSEVTKAKLLHFFEEKARTILDDEVLFAKFEESFKERSFELASTALLSFAEDWRGSDKTFAEILPDAFKNFYYEQREEKLPQLLSFAAVQLKENEVLNDSLLKLTVKIVEDAVNPLMGLFIKPEKVYTNLREHLTVYIENSENYPAIYESIDTILKMLADYKIKYVVSRFPEEDLKNFADLAAEKIREHIRIGDFTPTFHAAAQKFVPDFDEKLRAYLYRAYDEIVAAYGDALFRQAFETIKTRVLHIRISLIAAKVSAYISGTASASDKTEAFIRSIIERYAGGIVRTVNIKKIITENINGLEMDEAEKIIITVVNKELSAITLLGGLLGFLIGSVTVLFS